MHSNSKETYRTELKIWEINEDKDKMEHLEVLLRKTSHGPRLMGINKEGDCCMSIDSFNNIELSTMNDSTKHHIKLFLIGDLKGLFQIIGRIGFDSSYCLYCNCRPKTWNELCNRSNGPAPSTLWTLEDIKLLPLNKIRKLLLVHHMVLWVRVLHLCLTSCHWIDTVLLHYIYYLV